MSHDCDCSDCQETDSRWAYARRMRTAKEKDCPRGVHVAELWSTNPKPGEHRYRCGACNVWTDGEGKAIVYVHQTVSEAGLEMQIVGDFLQAPQCPIHKRYQAKRPPRVPCEACWRKYIHLNPR